MILWINGAFGAGKTTTAGLVEALLPDARIFDPEYVGYLLTHFVDAPTGDFQDLPLWRHLVVETLAGLDRQHPRTWIVPMSLMDPAYRAEILGGLRAAGAGVREVVLSVPEPELRRRIDADHLDPDARRWRQDRVTRATAAFAALPDADIVDATLPPDRVAEAVAVRAGR